MQNMYTFYCNSRVKLAHGGQVASYPSKWKNLTSDETILQIVAGAKIKFVFSPPQPQTYPKNTICRDHVLLADQEICKLVKKQVILECAHEPGEFVSPIFTVPKKNGSLRSILNLKKFNTYVDTVHFKMGNIHTILALVTPKCWMASIDLKDAYYSVPVHPEHQKCLKFMCNGKLYEYIALPNGLSTCPRIFTN